MKEYQVCKAITKEHTLAGGDRKLVILNATLIAIFILGFQNIVVIPVFLVFHALIIIATKKDSDFFKIFMRYIKTKKIYYP